ncbi:MAG TPA: uroporphyrinogen decarboxylase family protein [Dehalococcoidales bacterium]|nr:uroporphyrinogen decarboxylase family protein [Dehalococcoidales bacterium]
MPKKIDQAKTAEQICLEKEKRITDAIQLKIPDRVPVISSMGYFPAKAAGIPCSAAYYDFKAWYNAYKTVLPDYPADFIFPQGFIAGKALEILEPALLRWPGFNANPNHGHQTIEIANMQADEYDAFMADPSDYMFRIHMSRVSKNLAGLAKLPKLSDLSGTMGAQNLALTISAPETAHAFETLLKTGREMRRWQARIDKFNQLLLDLGFPQYFQGAAMPPYDIISHSMRGMSGTMMDMYRQPDKLIQACEKILELTLARPIPKPSPYGQIRTFMTNTRGSDDFLSNKMFDRFYWPTFKKLVLKLIERGQTPCIFFEGNFTSKLEYLLEFPKGKILARLDTTDIFKAKAILKDHTCLEGNVPSTILQVGTVQDVKDCCKKLIDVVGKDGGFILSPRSSTDEVKPENLKAMIDFTQEYGIYR